VDVHNNVIVILLAVIALQQMELVNVLLDILVLNVSLNVQKAHGALIVVKNADRVKMEGYVRQCKKDFEKNFNFVYPISFLCGTGKT